MSSYLRDLKEASETGQYGFIPISGVIMFADNSTVPFSWTECDGTNSTPDLRGKFVAGFGSSLAGVSTFGDTGGAASYTLALSNLPAHNHESSNIIGNTSGHTHKIEFDADGSHTHNWNVFNAGDHTHNASISNAGAHTHSNTTSEDGDHDHSFTLGNHNTHNHAGSITDTFNQTHWHSSYNYGFNSLPVLFQRPYISSSGSDRYFNQQYNFSKGNFDIGNSSHSHASGITDMSGAHTHTINTDTESNHTHNASISNAGAHTHSANLDSGGDHNHTADISNADGLHSHNYNSNTNGSHNHIMNNGGDGWGSSQSSIQTVPPFMMLKYIMRTE